MAVQPIIIIFQNRGQIFMGTWWVRLITVISFPRLQYLQTSASKTINRIEADFEKTCKIIAGLAEKEEKKRQMLYL